MVEINADDKRIKGVIIEAAGDVKHDGIIRADKDALVSIRTLGKYESSTGQIIQGKQKTDKWWEKAWFQIIMLLGAIAGIVSLYFLLK